jgi:hypothetical protein
MPTLLAIHFVWGGVSRLQNSLQHFLKIEISD